MKNRILTFTAIATLLFASSCQSPEIDLPSESRDGINSLTASFMNDTRDENSFSSEIDYDKGTITIVFPYTYPANSSSFLSMQDLTNMRMVANLDDNVFVEPKLLYMDLSQTNQITVTDQVGDKKTYTVTAEIRKSKECAITDFNLKSMGLSGVVDEEAKTISIVYLGEIGKVKADVVTSFGATMSPDPTATALDYDSPVSIKVTAQDGVTSATYTVQKRVPEKTTFGMRSGSAKILWKKKMIDDIGITADNMTGGMAVTSKYVVLNTRGTDMVYIDRATGENAGTIALTEKGSLVNFYCTSDEEDNILVNNLAPNAGNFKVWRINGVTGTPEVYIDWATGGLPIGRKLSVRGKLSGNAIITAAFQGATKTFARWTVVGGALASQTPEIVTINDAAIGAWNNNCDVIYADPAKVTSDYFMACYATPRAHLWMDATTNAIKHQGAAISSNWIINAVDYTVFNGCPYAAFNSVNSFTWGADDKAYLYDVSTDDGMSKTVWECDPGVYGSKAASGKANGNGTGDVALRVSDNGYYMYLYFMFTNGYVVCVQYDCIDM
ncbi:MAG: DUF5018 domain-containing protein [Bacteroidales bacterium]